MMQKEEEFMKNIAKGKGQRRDYVWWLSLLSVLGLFIVNVAGFVDTETGSALGCGHQWPLCNGSVIPSVWGLKTIIEFAHRAIVGGVTFLLLATAALAWRKYGEWLEVRVSILLVIGFVALEALLGALGVLFSDPPAILAIHLGVSLLAFAGIVLLTIVLAQVQHRGQKFDEGIVRVTPLRPTFLPRYFRFWTWFTLIYTFIALYIGALVASVGAGEYFRGFPFPTESYKVAGYALYLDILHRSVALGLVMSCGGLFVSALRVRYIRPDLLHGAGIAVVLVLLQGISGGLLIYTRLSIPAFLLHVSIVSGLFADLGYLGMQVLPEPMRRHLG